MHLQQSAPVSDRAPAGDRRICARDLAESSPARPFGAVFLHPIGGRLWAAFALALALCCGGCGNSEFDQVRAYKDFLLRAKPSLQGMNKVREELFNADSVEIMIVKFESGLLPNIQALHDLVDAESVTEGHLGQLHTGLKKTMSDYLGATKTLVDKLKAAKPKGAEDAAYYAAVEKALLEWGARDKDFGDQMSNIVSDLNSYLDELVKS